MNIRSFLVTVGILLGFSAFLYWLYSRGIGLLGIVSFIISGVVFVLISNYFYKQLWMDDE